MFLSPKCGADTSDRGNFWSVPGRIVRERDSTRVSSLSCGTGSVPREGKEKVNGSILTKLTTAMKTLNTLLIAGAMLSIQLPAIARNTTGSVNTTEADRILRQDKVRQDLVTPAGRKDKVTFERTVTLDENGQYAVIVKDAEGRLRMTGTYVDEALNTAHGQFTFYYPNGNVESSGMYANGTKTGTWERFAEDGTAKAERNYTGMTWEDMAVTLGEAAKAE